MAVTPTQPAGWKPKVFLVAWIYIAATWVAWYAAIRVFGSWVWKAAAVVVAAGSMNNVAEIEEAAVFRGGLADLKAVAVRVAGSLAMLPLLPIVVVPIGGLLVIQYFVAAAPLAFVAAFFSTRGGVDTAGSDASTLLPRRASRGALLATLTRLRHLRQGALLLGLLRPVRLRRGLGLRLGATGLLSRAAGAEEGPTLCVRCRWWSV